MSGGRSLRNDIRNCAGFKATEGLFWVGNLSESAVADEIEDLFRPFGKVLSVRLKTKAGSSANDARSFAFVAVSEDFPTAEALIALTGTLYQGRPLKLEDNTQITEHQRGFDGDAHSSRALMAAMSRRSTHSRSKRGRRRPRSVGSNKSSRASVHRRRSRSRSRGGGKSRRPRGRSRSRRA